MPYFVGLDVAKRTTKICVIDADGVIVSEGTVETEPKAIVQFLRGEGRRYVRIGLEAWSLSPWLFDGLSKARLPVVCVEVQHAHGFLKASRSNKTDRNDARGIAEMMRAGVFRPVHIKSQESRGHTSLLRARRFLKEKLGDVENSLNQLLLCYGLKLTLGAPKSFEQRVRSLAGKDRTLNLVIDPLLEAWRCIGAQIKALEEGIKDVIRNDPVCERLMTAPGVGPITALTYRAAIDDPARFKRSRTVGALFGLAPRGFQTGETDRSRRISKRGDSEVRRALFLAARTLRRQGARPSWLKAWGDEIATRRGGLRAIVAMARRLAVVLHRMWVTETDFRWSAQEA